jgi:hypothetical protein
MIGGPGTPGLLVARRELFTNRVPAVPGGGTVTYVGPTRHRYVEDIEHREEGGTPAIVESIRAGLVFALKEAVGADTIRALEKDFIGRAVESWSRNPNIEILGNPTADRLSIVSFVIRHGQRALHHNLVVTMLNDLFGIQSRGGCSCAGPYGHRLLGIDETTSDAFEREVVLGCEGIKPGWVRVNFNYFIDEETFQFIHRAVHLIADHGWRLAPQYRFDPVTGMWRHASVLPDDTLSLDDITFTSGGLAHANVRATEPVSRLSDYLADAERIMDEATADDDCPRPEVSDEFESLRWFAYPDELQRELALEKED